MEDILRADARIANLETTITRSEQYWPQKEIHYRMHPGNVACLTEAHLDVAVLANNHVLDWGRAGLIETLETLEAAGIRVAGAGRARVEARRPATVDLKPGRLVVFGLGSTTSGIPPDWAATDALAGVELLSDLDEATARVVSERIATTKAPGDVVVASIHWGDNWGHAIPDEQVRFAHALVDGGADVVHGHSSHHPRALEVYRRRLVLYGCGDLVNDYEGIAGYDEFRPELALTYDVDVEMSGELVELRMTPMRRHRMRLQRASTSEGVWLAAELTRASARFGSRVERREGGTLGLRL